jgi:uncharacterized protein YjbI with pentapeptide repeats
MIALKESAKSERSDTTVVFDYRKFNFSKLEYIEPKKKGNIVSSNIYYRASINKVINLFIRTPIMTTLSGICKKNNSYYIDLELDINKKHAEFYDFLNKFDDNNKNLVYQNSVDWFNQQLPKNIIDDYYVPSTNVCNESKFPIIRVKIRSKGDVIIPKIFNNYGAEVDLSYVNPKDEIEAILILDELRFFKDKYTPEWSLGQLKVFKKKNVIPNIPNQYLLEDENDLQDPVSENNTLVDNDSKDDHSDSDIEEEYKQKKAKMLENKKKKEYEKQIQETLEKERLEQERLEKERLENERLEQERLEQERLEKERLENERLEQERLEQERLEQERLEQERLEQERLEQERLEQERLEQERLEKKRLEQERLEKKRLEKERLEKERLEKERLEKIRIEKIQKLEELRLNEEKNRREQELILQEMSDINKIIVNYSQDNEEQYNYEQNEEEQYNYSQDNEELYNYEQNEEEQYNYSQDNEEQYNYEQNEEEQYNYEQNEEEDNEIDDDDLNNEEQDHHNLKYYTIDPEIGDFLLKDAVSLDEIDI